MTSKNAKHPLSAAAAPIVAQFDRWRARGSCRAPGQDDLVHEASFRVCGDHHIAMRFRSREAASWALFFEALGLQWAYEPEEFEVPGAGGLRHVPTFRVVSPQGLGAWYDCRPHGAEPDPLSELFSHSLSLLKPNESAIARTLNGEPLDVLVQPDRQQASPWGVCPRCGGIGVSRSAPIVLPSGRLSAGWDTVTCDACGHTLPADDGAVDEPGICGMRIHPFRGVMSLDVPKWLVFRRRVMLAAVEASQQRPAERFNVSDLA